MWLRKPLPLDALLLLGYMILERQTNTRLSTIPPIHKDTAQPHWQHHTAQSLACCISTQSSQESIGGATFTRLNHNRRDQTGEWQESQARDTSQVKPLVLYMIFELHYTQLHWFLQSSQSVAVAGHRVNENWPKSHKTASTKDDKLHKQTCWKQHKINLTNKRMSKLTNLSTNLCKKSSKVSVFVSFQSPSSFFYSTLSLLLNIKKRPSCPFFLSALVA